MFFESRFVYPGVWQRTALKNSQFNQIRSQLNFEVWKKEIAANEFVEAVFIPSQKKSSSLKTVIFAHGNNELIDDWFQGLSPYYTDLDFNVLLVEYRGYGRSKGTPSQNPITEDFSYFYDELVNQKGEQEVLVFHGRSIGGGVVSNLTRYKASTHLIIESSFSSLSKRAYELFRVPDFLIENKYPSDLALKTYDKPALILHGKRDNLIPVHHGRKLFKVLKGEKKFVEFDKGHNDIQQDRDLYWRSIQSFLQDSVAK